MEIGGRFDEKITLSQPDYERLHLGLVVAYRSIGVSIETEPVKGARSIRHLLTHRGRALKTGNDAKRDKKTFGWSDLDLRLSLDEVMAHLDALAVAVDDADRGMHGYAWRHEALTDEAVDTLTKAWPKLFGNGPV